jgi:hypothetical protein
MNQDHIKFIEDNKINFETVKLGYTKNIPIEILKMYEHIYHQYLNPTYVLTYWCGECVFDMLKRLMYYYEGLPKADTPEQIVETPIELVKPTLKKPTKSKK